MYTERKHQIEGRIVGLGMPFVCPIVRGKTTARVEFGPKLLVSMVNGYVFLENLSFDAFNEGTALQESVEAFKENHGHYPAAVYADEIFRNRENLRYSSLLKSVVQQPLCRVVRKFARSDLLFVFYTT